MGSRPKNMVEKYKWWGVVGLFIPLLILFMYFIIYNSDLTFNRERYILQKSYNGVVINKRDSQHGFHELSIQSSDGEMMNFDTGLMNIKFSKFVEIGDSIASESGEPIIRVFRSDSVYLFDKIDWTSYRSYKR
jgi:hypothetical protein